MRRLTQASLVMACLLPALCSSAFARISTPVRLDKDAGRADSIVVGQVVERSVSNRNQNGSATVNLRFHVVRVLKGSVSPGSDIDIAYAESRVDSSGVVMGVPDQNLAGTVLVLLSKRGDAYTFAGDMDSTIPASSVDRIGYVQRPDEKTNLAQEIRNSLLAPSKDVVAAALEQALVLSREEIRGMVAPLVEARDMDVRIGAMKACIASGELSVLPDVVSFLLQERSVDPSTQIKLALLKLELARAKVANQHIEVLAKALVSKDEDLRSAVCQAFGRSRNRAALPYLKAALDDTSVAVRYDAVIGMSRILGDHTPWPFYKEYAANPDAYTASLDYWKSRSIE